MEEKENKQKIKKDHTRQNEATELIKSGGLVAVYMIIGVIPGVAVSWITTVICRFFTTKPTAIELVVSGVACLIAQLAFIYILLFRMGYDRRDKGQKDWKIITVTASVIHLLLSMLLGFSVLVAGSACVHFAEYLHVLFNPETELPLVLADLPFYLPAVCFLAVEALYSSVAYLSILAGIKKRNRDFAV